MSRLGVPLDAALLYASIGWRVFPVWGVRADRCRCGKADCRDAGKHPIGKLVPHGRNEATTDEATIKRWWDEFSEANVGIATGKESGIFVLDVDPRHDGDASLADLQDVYGLLPPTVTANTGGGGSHFYFAYPEGSLSIRSATGLAGFGGLDVKGDGGYVVAPPSTHESGARYTWGEYAPDQHLPAEAPDWILDLVIQPAGEAASPAPFAEKLRDGERNSELYRMGRSLHIRRFTESAIIAALREENRVRCDPPLDAAEVREIARKAATQRDRADFRRVARPSGKATKGDGEPVLVTLADVEPEEVEWLWDGRIPIGKLSLLIGDPGLGKSFITLDLAARVSTGREWPDGSPCPSGDVILLAAEDGLSDTVRPRLDALGGDPARVHVLTAVRRGTIDEHFSLADDRRLLERIIVDKGARVVIIDPLNGYLGGKDSFNDPEVRSLLSPLSAMAEEQRVAVISVMHLNKDQQKQVLHRALGSIAFTAVARMVHAVAKDNDDEGRRFFLPVKNNLAANLLGLAFRLDAGGLHWEDSPVDVDVESVLAAAAGPRTASGGSAVAHAKGFLAGLLAGGPKPHDEVKRRAAEHGIKTRTLNRAKDSLSVHSRRDGAFGDRGESYWQLPDSDTELAKIASVPPGERPTPVDEKETSEGTGESDPEDIAS